MAAQTGACDDRTRLQRTAVAHQRLDGVGALGPGELPIRADTDAIAQIIVNLLSNAEKYSNGEKKIVIEASRREGPSSRSSCSRR